MERFDILYKKNRIKWPSRTGLVEPPSLFVPDDWKNDETDTVDSN